MVQAVEHFLPEENPIYVDPFCGVAEAAFQLELKNCILNDSNPHFINFYKHVKNGTFLKGRDKLSIRTGVTRPEWSANRAKFNRLLEQGKGDTADAAQLTFYLSHTCGAFTFGSEDANNPDAKRVFVGAQDLGTEVRVPEVDWQAAEALMQNWQLLNLADFNQFFDDDNVSETTDLVVSAPVVHRQQWDGTTIWKEADHEALRDRLTNHQGRVLLMHPRRRSVENIYSPWNDARINTRVFQVLPR
ncbi:MAG: DNA adenine methylase [Cyanobacteria bacterium P01_D01_bin.56]